MGSAKSGRKAKNFQAVASHLDNAQFTARGYTNAVKEGYTKNELVFSAIGYYKKSIGQSTIVVEDEDGEKIKKHPIQRVTTNPNSHMGEFNLLDIMTIHWFLAGNVFLKIVWNNAGTKPVELWPLMPNRVKILIDPEEVVRGYIYQIGGEEVKIPKDEMIHIREQDPTDLAVGISPLRAGFRSIDVDNEMTQFVKSLLENYAIPGVVMKLANRELIEDEDKRERMEQRFLRKFGGKQRGKPAFMGAKDELKTVGLGPDKLAFPKLTQINESRITSVLDIPSVLINTTIGLKRATFSNYEQARRAFWEDTMFGFQDRFASAFTEQLLRPMITSNDREPIDKKVTFDNSEVPAVQNMKEEEKEQDLKEWQKGTITLDEYRKRRNMDPIGGDKGDKLIFELRKGPSLKLGSRSSSDSSDGSGGTSFAEQLRQTNGKSTDSGLLLPNGESKKKPDNRSYKQSNFGTR